MNKFFSIAILLLCVTVDVCAQAPKFKWLHKIGDSGDEYPGQIENDIASNVYVTGTFEGQIILGTDTLVSTNAQEPSPFIVKYNSAGVVQWARKLPVSDSSNVARYDFSKVTVLPTGKIAVIGTRMYIGAGIKSYLAMLDDDGSLIYLKDQTCCQYFTDIDFDQFENAYLLVNDGYNSWYSVQKLNTAGTIVWSYTYSNNKSGYNINYNNGEVFVTGQFKHQHTLTDTQGTSPIPLTATWGLNDWDFFLSKYSSTGQLLSGTTYDGLVFAASGPFNNLSGSFNITNDWIIGWINDIQEVRTKRFSSTFATNPSNQIATTPCMFIPISAMKASGFKDEATYCYHGIVCNAGPGYRIDNNGWADKEFVIPAVGASSDVPPRALSIDSNSQMYLVNGFQGSFQYRDSLGLHTMSSNLGSPDMYVGKIYTCPQYNISIGTWNSDPDSIACILSEADPYAQYTWYLNGVVISGSTNSYHIATATGDYSVQVTNPWGCSETSGDFSIIVDNVEELAYTNFSIAPNPAREYIQIKGINGIIHIMDVVGRIILSTFVTNNERVEVGNFNSGVYFIATPEGVSKFLKE